MIFFRLHDGEMTKFKKNVTSIRKMAGNNGIDFDKMLEFIFIQWTELFTNRWMSNGWVNFPYFS